MRENLNGAQQRALQYWFVDGLAEISAGVISLMVAVLMAFWPVVVKGRWSLLIFFGLALAVSFGLRLVIQRVKSRLTYPRTGYVAPLSGFENRRAVIAIALFTLLLLLTNAFISTRGDAALAWSPALGGLVFAFLFAWTGYLTTLRRFYFLALFCLVMGVAVALLGFSYLLGLGLLTGCVGLVLLFLGLHAYRDYVRDHPAPGE